MSVKTFNSFLFLLFYYNIHVFIVVGLNRTPEKNVMLKIYTPPPPSLNKGIKPENSFCNYLNKKPKHLHLMRGGGS